MLLGTTYKYKQVSWLSLDNIDSFKEIINLKFDIIRLGIHWSDAQQSKKNFSYTEIKTLLDICEVNSQKTIVTIGMKAPGWPEFYFPTWVNSSNFEDITKYLYDFIENTTSSLKDYRCIYAWQIENEPLDPSGPLNLEIPIEILKHEHEIVRKIDPNRKILINTWGNDIRRNRNIKKVIPIADLIGLDIYYKQFIKRFAGIPLYLSPRGSLNSSCEFIRKHDKPLWITELQAEPWEENGKQYLSNNPKSMNIEMLKENYIKAMKLNPEAILFWGCEYWLWKKSKGDNSFLSTVKSIIDQNKNA